MDLSLDLTLDPTLDLYLDPNLDLDRTLDLNLEILNLNLDTVPGVTKIQLVNNCAASAELIVFVIEGVILTFIIIIPTLAINVRVI